MDDTSTCDGCGGQFAVLQQHGDIREGINGYCPACARLAALEAELARLRAALLEERAARLYYRLLAENAYGISAEWSREITKTSRVSREFVERFRTQARAELTAEGLLPPA